MRPAKIKLQKKVTVYTTSTWPNANNLHNEAFDELRQQMSQLGPNFLTWDTVMLHAPGRVNAITGMVFNAIRNRLAGLNGIVPKGWKDSTNTTDIAFENCSIQIEGVDIRNRNSFVFSIHFTTITHTLIDSIYDKILVAPADQEKEFAEGKSINPVFVKMDDTVSFHSYTKI